MDAFCIVQAPHQRWVTIPVPVNFSCGLKVTETANIHRRKVAGTIATVIVTSDWISSKGCDNEETC